MKRFRFFNRFTDMITRLVTRNGHGNTSTAKVVTSRQEQRQTPQTDQPVFGILLFLTHRCLRKQATTVTTTSNLTSNGLLLTAIYLPNNLITRTQATTTSWSRFETNTTGGDRSVRGRSREIRKVKSFYFFEPTLKEATLTRIKQ